VRPSFAIASRRSLEAMFSLRAGMVDEAAGVTENPRGWGTATPSQQTATAGALRSRGSSVPTQARSPPQPLHVRLVRRHRSGLQLLVETVAGRLQKCLEAG
jgi:hypothetical protein